MTQNEIYGKRAHELIPAGAHTYSRTDEVFPSNAPRVFDHTKAGHAWDVDGNEFIDFALACRSVTIGYANERIANAAIEQILKGNTTSKASKIEVDAAEVMCNLFPWVDMVKFAKNGSTVTSAATKLARAYTGKKYIARCLEHSFFSYDDWFIGDTLMDRGVPQSIKDLTLNFHFNDIESVKNLFEKYKGEIACLIMEPCESEAPKNNFLQEVRKLCTEYGVVYILDEMITGFRWDLLGACKYYGVEPDLVTFGKGMANGFSLAALGGKRDIMEEGGLIPGRERTFLISTTHGAEMGPLGAFVETVKFYKENNVTDRLWKLGTQMVNGLKDIAKEEGVDKLFKIVGEDISPSFILSDKNGNPSQEHKTVFCQELIKHGILMTYIALCYEHTDSDITRALEASRFAMKKYAASLDGNVKDFYDGDPMKVVFRKFN